MTLRYTYFFLNAYFEIRRSSVAKIEQRCNLEQTRAPSQQYPRRRGRDLNHRNQTQKHRGPRRSHSHHKRTGGIISCGTLNREDGEYFEDEASLLHLEAFDESWADERRMAEVMYEISLIHDFMSESEGNLPF